MIHHLDGNFCEFLLCFESALCVSFAAAVLIPLSFGPFLFVAKIVDEVMWGYIVSIWN
jgi:hypothetical protein